MLPLAQAGLTAPAVASRGLSEWLGISARLVARVAFDSRAVAQESFGSRTVNIQSAARGRSQCRPWVVRFS